MTRWLVVALPAALVGLALLRASRPLLHPAPLPMAAAEGQEPSGAPRAAPPAVSPFRATVAEEVRAHSGTDVDGDPRVDPRGRFRVDGEAKRFFDYFLLAEGELTDSAIRQRVLEALEHRVPAEAVSQGMDVYDRYVGFRRRAAVARATPGGTPEEGIAALRALEDEAFGEDAPAFFARERELAARVPPPSPGPAAVVAPGGADAVGMRAALELEAQLAAVAEADRYRARAEHLGPSAAQRLARLDAENAAWRARLDAYLAARDELLQDRQLSDGVRTRRLEELRAPFTAAERGRLPTFERVHDRQRAGAQGEEPAEQR